MSNDTSNPTSTINMSSTSLPPPIPVADPGRSTNTGTPAVPSPTVPSTTAPSATAPSAAAPSPTNGDPPSPTSLKQAIFDLLTSKKFLVALASIAMWVTGRFGLDADPAVLDRIWLTLMVFIFGQGLADIGKGKTVAAARLPTGVSGLIVLCLIGPSLTACTALKGAEAPTEAAAIECASVDIGPAFNEVQTKCNPNSTIDNQCAEQVALADLKSAGDCLLIRLLDDAIGKLSSPSTTTAPSTAQATSVTPHTTADTRTLTTTPTTPPTRQADIQQWRDTVESFRVQHANGAKFRVDGVLR
jgi:hypothetical protein